MHNIPLLRKTIKSNGICDELNTLDQNICLFTSIFVFSNFFPYNIFSDFFVDILMYIEKNHSQLYSVPKRIEVFHISVPFLTLFSIPSNPLFSVDLRPPPLPACHARSVRFISQDFSPTFYQMFAGREGQLKDGDVAKSNLLLINLCGFFFSYHLKLFTFIEIFSVYFLKKVLWISTILKFFLSTKTEVDF